MHRTAFGAVQVSNRITREIATPRLRSGQAVPLASPSIHSGLRLGDPRNDIEDGRGVTALSVPEGIALSVPQGSRP